MIPLLSSSSSSSSSSNGQILDVSWTVQLESKWWWDKFHFEEPVYRSMNEEVLERLLKHTTSSLIKRFVLNILILKS